MSVYLEPLLYINLLITAPAAILSLIIWFILKKRDSVWLIWLYRLRCVGAAFYVGTGILGLLDEERFTFHSEGGQDGVKWFSSSLLIALLIVRRWGKPKEVTLESNRNESSSGLSTRNKSREALGAIAFLAAFVVALYGAREAIKYMRTPSQAKVNNMIRDAMHDGMVKAMTEMKSRLPIILDNATTLRDVKVENVMTIYINEIDDGYQIADITPLRDIVTAKVCASSMRKSILDGGSYRYEYWSVGNDGKLLGAFDIRSCP